MRMLALGRPVDAAASWLLAEPRALHGAALCRIGTALSVLGLLTANFSTRHVWAGPGAVWAEPARALSQFPELTLLDGVSGDVLTLFYVVTMAAAAAMALGWHTKAANGVTLVGFIAVVSQNPVVGDEGDNLVRITLLWLLLMRTADRWSIDGRRRERREAPAEEALPPWLSAGLHHVGLIGLAAQTLLVLLAGGLDKISQDAWQRGTALYSTMQLPELRPYPGLSDAISTSSVALGVLTYSVLLTQLLFAPLLLHRATRRVVIAATILVNTAVAVLLALPWSSLALLSLTALFVSTETYERADEWLRARLAPVGDWSARRWYDVQDVASAVLERTWWPVADRVRETVRRRGSPLGSRHVKILNSVLGLLLVGVVAAIVLFFTTRSGEEEQDAAPPPDDAVTQMSTSGVVANIERRLASASGFPVTVRCPKKVDESIGTTFRCSVRREGGKDRIAIARVKIRGAGGQFGWTSTPVAAAGSAP